MTTERARLSRRSAPSWARVKPDSKKCLCSQPPITTKAAAVLHRRRNGNQSKYPFRYDMIAPAAHSLGSHTEVGVRNTATKSTRSWNSSGRIRRSGLKKRKSAITPAAAKRPTSASRSRVRRAGDTFTSIKVTALPMTAGTMRNGKSVPSASK